MGFRGMDRFRTDPTGTLAANAPSADMGGSGIMGSGVSVGRVGMPVTSAAVPGQTGGTGIGGTMTVPIGGRDRGYVQKKAKGGKVDGVAKKGKTKTKMVKMAKGGSVSSRADGCCTKGKTKGKMR